MRYLNEQVRNDFLLILEEEGIDGGKEFVKEHFNSLRLWWEDQSRLPDHVDWEQAVFESAEDLEMIVAEWSLPKEMSELKGLNDLIWLIEQERKRTESFALKPRKRPLFGF